MSQPNDIDLAVTGFYAITYISHAFLVPWCEGMHDKIFNNGAEKSDMAPVLISDMQDMSNLFLKFDFVDGDTEISEFVLTTSGNLSTKEREYIKRTPGVNKKTVPQINVGQLSKHVAKFNLHESLIAVISLALTELLKDIVQRVTNPYAKLGFEAGKVSLYIDRPNQNPVKVTFDLKALERYCTAVETHYKNKVKSKRTDAVNSLYQSINV